MALNQHIWHDYLGKKLLLAAMSLVLITHGIIIYYTLPDTYDAYVHIFFADHYARFWFEPWEYRWYTGFLTISYPPLVHQCIALISKIFPLKIAFCIYSIFVMEVFIVGMYRVSKIFFSKTVAGVAAILTVLLSSVIETLHIFGQMPTLTGIAFLLNALPFLYLYIIKRKVIYLVMCLAFLSVVICSHHVTAIFGMIFFIAPTIITALTDIMPPEKRSRSIFLFVKNIIRQFITSYKPILIFGILMIVLAIALIFPYWYWSKTDPISQVSIPHGSRDNFFRNTSSGLVFYIIPLILVFAFLPAITYTIIKKKRYLGWAASFFMCLLLGSGGTTPLPKLMLGSNAFSILTLDRFGFWASIIAAPFMAHFIYSFLTGNVFTFCKKRWTSSIHFILASLTGFAYLIFIVFVFHLAQFRPLQPKEINIQPILNFLNRDDHVRWRYLTVGFGDQMAWLSANSLAATVDGNYHSARRLPELTTRPVERLENAKFSGKEGLASLTDFLTNSEKYNLKYIFSNDRYYDPILYYSGWNRTIRLENGIMIWEKQNIATIKPIAYKSISPWLRYAWGLIPVASLIFVLLLSVIYIKRYKEPIYYHVLIDDFYPRNIIYASSFLPLILSTAFIGYQVYELLLVKQQHTPEQTVQNFYNRLDFQEFDKAYRFFLPSSYYTLDQYLLEKSVTDGGLLPSYSKLDSIVTKRLKTDRDTAQVQAFTLWRTSVGYISQVDTLQLINRNGKWYIMPPTFHIQIPETQIRDYTYTLFKKQGKRVISSFPTVKDDRTHKPLINIDQINLIKNNNAYYIVGEVTNTDNIPAYVSIRAVIEYGSHRQQIYYTKQCMLYNLLPRAGSVFKIPIDSISSLKDINALKIYVETDVSEKGYIHGGTVGYKIKHVDDNTILIDFTMYNELTTELTIPGILIAERDTAGRIWQVDLYLHHRAIRSGLETQFQYSLHKMANKSSMITNMPISVIVNGKHTKLQPVNKESADHKADGFSAVPHCFIAPEIYLQ